MYWRSAELEAALMESLPEFGIFEERVESSSVRVAFLQRELIAFQGQMTDAGRHRAELEAALIRWDECNGRRSQQLGRARSGQAARAVQRDECHGWRSQQSRPEHEFFEERVESNNVHLAFLQCELTALPWACLSGSHVSDVDRRSAELEAALMESLPEFGIFKERVESSGVRTGDRCGPS